MDECARPRAECLIRPLRQEDVARIEDIAAAAWAPIYEHLAELQARALGAVARPSSIEQKREQVRTFAQSRPDGVLVTECDGQVVGFITFSFDREHRMGVIGNNAMQPDYAGRGLGTAQYREVLDLFRAQGMLYASVGTGLDESHAPARRAYERVGFVPVLASVEYMMKL